VTILRMRRLLVLLPGDRFGGAEAHTLRLCAAAEAAGVAVTVAAGTALYPLAAAPGRSVLDLPVTWRRGLVETAREAQAGATRTALSVARPDAALLPLPWPDRGGGAMQALAEAGIPALIVAHLAPHGAERPPGLDEQALAAAAAMRADWVAVSAPTAERFARYLNLPPGRVATIPNGVDPPPALDRDMARQALRSRLGLSGETPVALFLGRLDEAKGADRLPLLAEAFARRTGGVIACAGTGSLAEMLRNAAPEGHPLRLLGRHSRPAELLAAADALLLPSRLEGAPLAFLEAASWGLPVVASPEALEALGPAAGSAAALAWGDDAAEMADALAEAVGGGHAVLARVEAALRLAALGTAEDMAARYLARLRRLPAPPLGGPGAG
jgi:glycosyltransferase involved in cell wall biosynthesis